MSVVRGENCLLEAYHSGNWEPYACARSCSLSSVTEMVEVSVTGSGKYKHFAPTVNSFTGNIEGITHLNKPGFLTLYQLRQFQLGHVLQRVRFTRESDDGNFYINTVDFYITNVTDTISFDNVNTFTVDLQGTGVLGQTIFEPPIIITAVKRYEFTAVGGELGFTEALLENKDILAVHKDGIGNSKIVTSGSPASKEVKYTTGTGTFLWAVEFEPGEEAYILYQDL